MLACSRPGRALLCLSLLSCGRGRSDAPCLPPDPAFDGLAALTVPDARLAELYAGLRAHMGARGEGLCWGQYARPGESLSESMSNLPSPDRCERFRSADGSETTCALLEWQAPRRSQESTELLLRARRTLDRGGLSVWSEVSVRPDGSGSLTVDLRAGRGTDDEQTCLLIESLTGFLWRETRWETRTAFPAGVVPAGPGGIMRADIEDHAARLFGSAEGARRYAEEAVSGLEADFQAFQAKPLSYTHPMAWEHDDHGWGCWPETPWEVRIARARSDATASFSEQRACLADRWEEVHALLQEVAPAGLFLARTPTDGSAVEPASVERSPPLLPITHPAP